MMSTGVTYPVRCCQSFHMSGDPGGTWHSSTAVRPLYSPVSRSQRTQQDMLKSTLKLHTLSNDNYNENLLSENHLEDNFGA